MKKLYVLATALIIGASAQAQIIDFENFLPAVDTFDNGSSGAGAFNFTSGMDLIEFSNSYNTQWSSWTGFSISNMTDVTTPGYQNQYSSWTGSGYNGSDAYAVFYEYGTITAGAMNTSIEGFKITNTTYAALSMRDGDGWGKQFGSIYNGDSTVIDGTNGEDFYRVWVYGTSHDQTQVDSVEIYLADYRFTDDTQDYIADDWIDVDLTGFGFFIGEISFKIESSDTTGGWINTPTYFAIDDVLAVTYSGLGEQQLQNVSVYPNPVQNQLNIKGEEGELTIASSNGQVVFRGTHSQLSSIDVSDFSNGIYVIHLVNASGSYTNRFIKQ